MLNFVKVQRSSLVLIFVLGERAWCFISAEPQILQYKRLIHGDSITSAEGVSVELCVWALFYPFRCVTMVAINGGE